MSTRSLGVSLALWLVVFVPPAWAHGDHGAAPPGVTIIAPRTEARIGAMEVVAVFSRQTLAVFVSRFADGAPVAGAKVSLSSDLQSADLEETDSGLYVTRDILLSPGHNDLTVSLTVGGATKTQSIGLSLPAEHAAPANPVATPTPVRWTAAIGSAVAALLLASGAMMLWRRVRRVRALDGAAGIGLRWQGPA